jgi:hypothetical protein
MMSVPCQQMNRRFHQADARARGMKAKRQECLYDKWGQAGERRKGKNHRGPFS